VTSHLCVVPQECDGFSSCIQGAAQSVCRDRRVSQTQWNIVHVPVSHKSGRDSEESPSSPIGGEKKKKVYFVCLAVRWGGGGGWGGGVSQFLTVKIKRGK